LPDIRFTPPRELTALGQEAWDAAVEIIKSEPDPDRMIELARRYARWVSIADKCEAEWVDLGSPPLMHHDNGASYTHPLIKSIDEADKLAHRFGDALGLKLRAKRPGRPKTADRQPDAGSEEQEITPSPGSSLRAVA
jgi:hypothetical protein